MPNALTFIVGADSQPFAKEMRQMERIAMSSAHSIGARLAEGSHMGFSGVIRESITLGREAIEGRGIGRILGSGTLLAQYLFSMGKAAKEAGSEAQIAADKVRLLAMRQALAAQEAANHANYLASVAKSEAGLNFHSDTTAKKLAFEAAQQVAVAKALDQKATALQKVADIKKVEGAILNAELPTGLFGAVGPWSIVLGIVGAIAAGLFVGYEITKKMVSELSSLKLPDFKAEYIAKQSQAMNHATEEAKKLREEIEKVDDAYNSAAEASERISKLAEQQFEHAKNMLSLEKERDLQSANSASEKMAVEKKYLDAELSLSKQYHDQELQRRRDDISALEAEKDAKLAAAAAIMGPDGKPLSSPERDAENLSHAKANAEAAQKYLDSITQTPEQRAKKVSTGGPDEAYTEYIDEDILQAQTKKDQDSRDLVKAYKDAVDNQKASEELRKKRDELEKQGNASGDAAEKLRISIGDLEKKLGQQDKNDAESNAVKEAIKRRGSYGGNRIEHDELEHISGRPSLIIANDSNRIAKDTNHVLHRINDKLDKISGRPSHPGAGRY